MIRLPRGATLNEIRTDLAAQLPTTPKDYRFVRLLHGEVTLLSPEQEQSSCKIPLHAYNFAPPYTARPEIVLLTRKMYTEGETIEDETKTRELKSLASALAYPSGKSKGRNPRDMVKDKAAVYINAFINSAGGVLLLGATDDGVIERVALSGAADAECQTLEARVKLARQAKDDIRKLVDSVALHMDPVVDDDLVTTLFVPVKRSEEAVADELIIAAEEEIYNAIEIHVKPGRRSLYFLEKHSMEAYERRDGSTNLMDEAVVVEALTRRKGADGWCGGWRQLRSPFDFDALMRRISNPWAGREWLFAAIRQALFADMIKNCPSGSQMSGVGIVGTRGIGKTSFLSELTLRPKNATNLDVVAHHICRADDPDTLNPALFVQSLAAMLARGCKEYRSLMIDSSIQPGAGDSIGAVVLRALRPEHCENDPDDAFLRGILHPLWEIERRRGEQKGRRKQMLPWVVVVDAIDESLATDTVRRRHSGTSPTIAHLLERALTNSGGFPRWMKLVVSIRQEMIEVSGPIERLAQRLDLIQLDPNSPIELQQAQEDIRLFVEAYLEQMRMLSPLGNRTGSGVWSWEKAGKATKTLRALRGETPKQWQHEVGPGKWVAFDELVMMDLDYATKTGLLQCCLAGGSSIVVADLREKLWIDFKTGKEQRIRLCEDEDTLKIRRVGGGLFDANSVSVYAGDSSASEGRSCFRCKRVDHTLKDCPEKNQEEGEAAKTRAELIKRENSILDDLAFNSKGNYLYARSVLEDIRGGRLQWEQVSSLPCGLDHLYTDFFRLHFGSNQSDREAGSSVVARKKAAVRIVRPVLEVLLAATKRGVTERDIAHAVVAGAACDPTAVAFCLRDIRWALGIDNSRVLPRYSLRHESIRAWLKEKGTSSTFGLREERGHALLASSLLQRCWPQQTALASWLSTDKEYAARKPSAENTTDSTWYNWNGWVPNAEDEDILNLVTHLSLSGLGGNEERTELLRSVGRDILDSVCRGKTTALHLACSAGNIDGVGLLLAAGASPDVSVRGRTPLHSAASKGYSETVEALLAAGADVLSTTTSGRTALLNASARGSASTVKSILEWIARSSNLDSKPWVDMSQTDNGRTPLSVAAEEGHDEVLRLLLNSDASVYLSDRWGRSPLYYGT
jgi:hypothetical protein